MCSTAFQDVTSLNRGLFALLEPALQQELGGVLFGPQLWHRLSTVIEIKMMSPMGYSLGMKRGDAVGGQAIHIVS
jgi:hypothetical protein